MTAAALVTAPTTSASGDGLIIGIGGPVVAALIVALVTWILRLLAERRKADDAAHRELVKTVDDLANAVKEITLALGGQPATAFEPKRIGIVESTAALAVAVAALNDTALEHARKIGALERKAGRPA